MQKTLEREDTEIEMKEHPQDTIIKERSFPIMPMGKEIHLRLCLIMISRMYPWEYSLKNKRYRATNADTS